MTAALRLTGGRASPPVRRARILTSSLMNETTAIGPSPAAMGRVVEGHITRVLGWKVARRSVHAARAQLVVVAKALAKISARRRRLGTAQRHTADWHVPGETGCLSGRGGRVAAAALAAHGAGREVVVIRRGRREAHRRSQAGRGAAHHVLADRAVVRVRARHVTALLLVAHAIRAPVMILRVLCMLPQRALAGAAGVAVVAPA